MSSGDKWVSACKEADDDKSGDIDGKEGMRIWKNMLHEVRMRTNTSSDTSVGWKAMSVHAFMLRGIEFFQYFVPKGHEKEESWVCFKLHCLYYALLQKTSFEKIDIVNLDSLICKQQTLFLKIDHYVDLWKPKNHWATHFPVDIIRFGPPVYWSELKFEMKHQWLKRCARLSNFIGLLSTIAFNSEMRACLDLFEGVHLNFIRE